MCTCFVVSDRPSFRKSPSIRLKFGHSESHGALSLFVEPRQLCQGYASLDGVPYGLVWLLTHERFSLPYRPGSTQQGVSHSYSIRLPCCSASRLSRPKRSAQKSRSSLRAPTTCSVRRPVFLTFTCVPLSLSPPGSLAVTLAAIAHAVVSFRLLLQSSTVYLRARYIFRSSSRYSSGSAKCQATGSLPLALLRAFLSSVSARKFVVGFHSNRPSIDPLVGSPPSLRGHSTGALSLCIYSSQTLTPFVYVAEQTLILTYSNFRPPFWGRVYWSCYQQSEIIGVLGSSVWFFNLKGASQCAWVRIERHLACWPAIFQF